MPQVSYRLYAYCRDNGAGTYGWVEQVRSDGRSRLVRFDGITFSVNSPVDLWGVFADINSLIVDDSDNYWANLASASNGLVNSSDSKWYDWYHRPLKLAICDESGTAVRSIVVLLDDITISEPGATAELSVIGLARAASEAMADGEKVGGNTIYGAWGSDTSPTLFAAYTEDIYNDVVTKTWFRNRRIVDILKKQVYALNHDGFGTPQIETITVFSDTRPIVSMRSDPTTSNVINDVVMGPSGYLFYVAGDELWQYAIATDTHTKLYDGAGTDYHRLFYNSAAGDSGRIYLLHYDNYTGSDLYEYDISAQDVNGSQPTDYLQSAQTMCFNQAGNSGAGAIFWTGGGLGGHRGQYNYYTCSDITGLGGWTQIAGGDLPVDPVSGNGYDSGTARILLTPDGHFVCSAMGDFDNPPYALYWEVLIYDPDTDTFTDVGGRYYETAHGSLKYLQSFAVQGESETAILFSWWDGSTGWGLGAIQNDIHNPQAPDAYADSSYGGAETRRILLFWSDAFDDSGRVYYIRNNENKVCSCRYDPAGPLIYLWEENRESDDAVFGLPMFCDDNIGIYNTSYAIAHGVYDSANAVYYGFAAPDKTMFQLAAKHSGFLHLLKWDGMSLADICDACARAQNAIWYYDEDGVFHYEQLKTSGLVSVKDFAEGEAISVALTSGGRKDVVNRYLYNNVQVKKVVPETGQPYYEQAATSDMRLDGVRVLLSCAEVKHWRIVITNGGTGAFSLQSLDDNGDFYEWTEQATGTIGTELTEQYLIIPADAITGTYATGDAAYFYVLPTQWDFEDVGGLNRLSVQDDTSIARYQRQDKDVDAKFIDRNVVLDMMTAWLNITKDPKQQFSARLPYEGNENTLKVGAIITLTSAKLGLTSSNKLKITSLAWSGDSCRIAVTAELLQMT